MNEVKEQVSAAISRAKADLEQALGTLEKIPSFDTDPHFFTPILQRSFQPQNASLGPYPRRPNIYPH